MTATFLGIHTGSFSTPAAGNPTVVMVEAAYRHHGLDARYLNCEVPPEAPARSRSRRHSPARRPSPSSTVTHAAARSSPAS